MSKTNFEDMSVKSQKATLLIMLELINHPDELARLEDTYLKWNGHRWILKDKLSNLLTVHDRKDMRVVRKLKKKEVKEARISIMITALVGASCILAGWIAAMLILKI